MTDKEDYIDDLLGKMPEKKETGGYAFPQSGFLDSGKDCWVSSDCGGSGMTLRDYFAAKCMQGDWASGCMDSGYWSQDDIDVIFKDKAETYYRMADAMLKARG
ncbi:hypothetical protein [Proteus sp. NMG38-2]|uniref:hypothetical protein n=1 Tax=Proteus sp. NMG38-2 TaxID=2883107 RepID=UPI001D0A5077|nr:hypothetical protein [Proteus sp. NMG38-2]UDN34581.1 hypothetical protein LG402_12500 [Proteus sp. NMG38-2]